MGHERIEHGPSDDVKRRIEHETVRIAERAALRKEHRRRNGTGEMADAVPPLFEDRVDEIRIDPVTEAVAQPNSGAQPEDIVEIGCRQDDGGNESRRCPYGRHQSSMCPVCRLHRIPCECTIRTRAQCDRIASLCESFCSAPLSRSFCGASPSRRNGACRRGADRGPKKVRYFNRETASMLYRSLRRTWQSCRSP